jgi:hypothetical protein
LEGNSKSLLDARELFLKGRSPGDDTDATMLLNHKDAIEFIVDAVPTYGITMPVVCNVQSILMNGLLVKPAALGAIRSTIVNISDTVYVPSQVPALLDEMLRAIVGKARAIRNPIECAFFLRVNIAYLQPFEDGNKRTSRLASNLPLLLWNCAPLSFLNVEPSDYAMAMLGLYEQQDVSLAADLFGTGLRKCWPESWSCPGRVGQVLIQRLAGSALIRIISALHAAYLAALLVGDIVVIERVLLRRDIGHTQQLRRPVVALHGLALGERFVHLAAYVHALVSENIQTLEFLLARSTGMVQIRRQDVAPWMLNADFAGSRVCVPGGQHLGVEHGVEGGIAVNYRAMMVREFGRFRG